MSMLAVTCSSMSCRAQVLAQPRRHLDQQRVAGIVAVRVVDLLEAVEVDEDQRELAVATARALYRLLERRPEAGAVGEPGERIAVGERRDALARERDLGDVAPDAAVAEEAAAGAEARLAAHREGAHRAIFDAARELEIADRLAAA